MHPCFTDRARKVLQLAQQEAIRCGHEYVGTEHLLLGLAAEDKGIAASVLSNLGLDPDTIRREVESMVEPGDAPAPPGKLPITPRATKVLDAAMREARSLRHFYVGTEHILLGLLDIYEGVAAQVFVNLDLDFERIREEVFHVLGVKHRASPGRAHPSHGPARVQEEGLPADLQDQVQAVDRQLADMAAQKQQAVQEMRFEQAALLRDAIDRLKKKRRGLLHQARHEPLHVIEFELVVPLRRPDGSMLDEPLLAWIRQKLHDVFGGCAYGTLHVEGTWALGTTELEGDVGVFRVLVDEGRQPRDFFAAFKEELHGEPVHLDRAAVLERKVDVV